MSLKALENGAKAPPGSSKVKTFVYERTGKETLTAYGVSERIYFGQTQYQQMELWRSSDHGKLLLLDGELQSASEDEFIYHETLVHPALLRCANARTALILGGGEGGTLRETLRARSIEKVAMVDIDAEVVDLCQKVLPEQSNGAFQDPRAELIIGDALQHLREVEESYDLIVSDLTEPKVQDLSTSLFEAQSFELVRSRLNPGGVFALQASQGTLGQTGSHLQIIKRLRSVFRKVQTLLVHIPSFCCHWCFALASNEVNLLPSKEFIEQRLKERGIEGLKFYDGETDIRLRSLPLYLRKELRAL